MDKDHVSGNGTYEHLGYIHSSIVGTVKIVKTSSDSDVLSPTMYDSLF